MTKTEAAVLLSLSRKKIIEHHLRDVVHPLDHLVAGNALLPVDRGRQDVRLYAPYVIAHVALHAIVPVVAVLLESRQFANLKDDVSTTLLFEIGIY